MAFSRLWRPRRATSSQATTAPEAGHVQPALRPRGRVRSRRAVVGAPRRRRPGRLEAVGQDRQVAGLLGGEQAQLRVAVALQAAVAVEVVGREVQERGRARPEASRRPRAGSWSTPPPARRRGRTRPPARPAASPGCRRRSPPGRRPAAGGRSSSVVVVLPLVPVIPTRGLGSSRAASSISLQTGTPAVRAPSTGTASPGTPGLFTARSRSGTGASQGARTSHPGGGQLRRRDRPRR